MQRQYRVDLMGLKDYYSFHITALDILQFNGMFVLRIGRLAEAAPVQVVSIWEKQTHVAIRHFLFLLAATPGFSKPKP